MRTVLLLVTLGLGVLAGPASAKPKLPPPDARFDYQIGGAYQPASRVEIVDRDRGAPPARGRYNICYVNAFQAQPDAARWWKRRHSHLLLRHRGRYVVDGAWNEILLDTSTRAKRARLLRIVGRWIDGCARSGYDAVEPDNLDSYSRSRHRLTLSDNRAMARLLVARAHRRGLAIAQKNTAELRRPRRTIGFDFAIAEECQVYHECGRYTRVYGNRVFEIEYNDNGGLRNFRAACSARGARVSIIYRDRDVVRRGAAGYRYRAC